MMVSIRQRAIACLNAVAVGDIVGRAGGGHTPYSIQEMYHSPITDLVKPQRGPMKKKKKLKWDFCQTSDDTIFTLAIAKGILNGEFICRRNVVCELRAISNPLISNVGLNHLKQAKTPDYFHPEGEGPGSAMRVSPIGLIWSPNHLEDLVEDVAKTSVMTHGDSSAISAACAVAGAISAALESLSPLDILRLSQKAASLGRKWGKPSTLPDIAQLTEQAYESIKHIPPHDFERLYLSLHQSVGIKREACFLVPIAVAIAIHSLNAREAILIGTNLGNDADTTASIAGAIAAAIHPKSLPTEWVDAVEQKNDHQISKFALLLIEQRDKLKSNKCILHEEKVMKDHPNCFNCVGWKRFFQDYGNNEDY